MQVLRVKKIEEFIKRFGEFGDALVREIRIVYYRNAQPTTVELTLTVLDSERLPGDYCVDLHLRVCDVSKFSFNEGPPTWQIVSEGEITANGGELTINLDLPSESPPDGVLSSKFFVTGSRIEWELTEITGA